MELQLQIDGLTDDINSITGQLEYEAAKPDNQKKTDYKLWAARATAALRQKTTEKERLERQLTGQFNFLVAFYNAAKAEFEASDFQDLHNMAASRTGFTGEI